ncbi:MAG: ATP-binding protein [Longimicrobiales bacterium]
MVVFRSRRRLVALFLAAVVLPSALLIVLTVRGMRQERELAEQRTLDEHARTFAQVRQALRAHLERIASQELSARSARTSATPGVPYADSSVRLVADVIGGRLVLPWESAGGFGRSNTLFEGDFGEKLRDAESAEFGRGDLVEAATLYRDAVAAGRRTDQAGYARLALARTLSRLGRSREAEAQYAQVFASGFDVTDEHGVPLALYAATRLPDSTPASVLDRLSGETRQRCCLAPEALYMLRQILDSLASRASLETDSAQAASLGRLLDERIRTAEQIVTLAAELSALGLRPQPRSAAPGWVVLGLDPWFARALTIPGDSTPVVVAIDATSVLDAVNRTLPSGLGVTGLIRTAAPDDAPDRLLGPDFPSLSMEPGPASASAGDSDLARLFYVGTLVVVLGVTLFGAYLLWFDVRRELRMAELRSQFVSSVSHELKTPLTAIRMFAETLALDSFQDPAARREYIDTIVNETERLTRLLDNVLDLSKIERGQKQYRFRPTELPEVVERCARMLQYPLAQRGFRLHVDTAEALPPLTADEDALEQAVLNLLTNAMKYSGDSRDIHLRLHRANGEAIISVEDHGVGIPAPQKARVVEKFYRVPSPENAGIPGTGLGLTLVDHIVTAHKGKLAIESEPGLGSTFSIHLPLEPAQ